MAWIAKLTALLNDIVKGKEEAVKMSVVTLVSGGHLLIEDVPGVGKTTLALGLARATACTFNRIQFTSDLLPSDILGVNIYNPAEQNFRFKPGPIFANIVLADEINRTNPKTQSALLEAMNEHRVSIDRETHSLPNPFMVIATQNPLEYHGTFPLPESQMDRFMMHLHMGYPPFEQEKKALMEMRPIEDLEKLTAIVTVEDILKARDEVSEIFMDESLVEYILQIVGATRKHEEVRLGVSTRGARFMVQASKGYAFLHDRDFVVPDDIQAIAPFVIGHRILLKRQHEIRHARELVDAIIRGIPRPV
jgi:MoxR-like ATPase